jgi:hypothetical protein
LKTRPPVHLLSIAALWCFSGLVLSLEMYFNSRTMRGYSDVGDILITQFGRAGMWALLAPWILELGRQLPPVRPAAVLFHLFFGFVFMAVFYLGRIFSISLYWHVPLKEFWSTAVDSFYGRNLVDLVYYFAVLAFGQGLRAQQRYRQEELRAAQLQSKLVEAELRALKHQLDPHFLFNTLNSVTVLIRDRRNEEAVELISKVSTLLRMSLENTRIQTTSSATRPASTRRPTTRSSPTSSSSPRWRTRSCTASPRSAAPGTSSSPPGSTGISSRSRWRTTGRAAPSPRSPSRARASGSPTPGAGSSVTTAAISSSTSAPRWAAA